MPAITNDTMERLAFIRALYQLGVEQSQRPEPMNVVALLMFHDAADSLVQLAAEVHDLDMKGKQTFLVNYIDELNIKLGGRIEGRGGMVRLNTARNGLKHQGLHPGVAQVDSLRSLTTNFFESNVPVLFGIEFDQISMARMVSLPEARKYLEESEAVALAGDLEGALQAIATAFAFLMRQHSILEPGPYHRRRVSFASRISGVNAFLEHEVQSLGDQVDLMGREMNELQERVTFLALDIAPSTMKSFKEISPSVSIAFDGTPRVEGPRYARLSPLTLDDVRFCYDFVIGVALALQRRW